MQVAENPAWRQAALALHELSSEDRERVWSRLDPEKRSSLEPLLTELVELGVPAGRPWSPNGREVRSPSPDVKADLPALARQVRRLEPGVVLQALSAQSLDTVSAILSAQPWPWRDAVMQAWPPESRHSLSQRMQEHNAPSAFVLRIVLSALLQEARSLPVSLPSVSKREWWITRLFHR